MARKEIRLFRISVTKKIKIQLKKNALIEKKRISNVFCMFLLKK